MPLHALHHNNNADTANISTTKNAKFQCVSISNVIRLHFWHSVIATSKFDCLIIRGQNLELDGKARENLHVGMQEIQLPAFLGNLAPRTTDTQF